MAGSRRRKWFQRSCDYLEGLKLWEGESGVHGSSRSLEFFIPWNAFHCLMSQMLSGTKCKQEFSHNAFNERKQRAPEYVTPRPSSVPRQISKFFRQHFSSSTTTHKSKPYEVCIGPCQSKITDQIRTPASRSTDAPSSVSSLSSNQASNEPAHTKNNEFEIQPDHSDLSWNGRERNFDRTTS